MKITKQIKKVERKGIPKDSCAVGRVYRVDNVPVQAAAPFLCTDMGMISLETGLAYPFEHACFLEINAEIVVHGDKE